MNVPVMVDVFEFGCSTRTPPCESVVSPLIEVGATKFAVVPGKFDVKLNRRLQFASTLYVPPPRDRVTWPLEIDVCVILKLPAPSVEIVPI
jgi:hypothetical protein